MTQTNLLSGLVTFIVYGLGMALVLIAVTVALALGKSSIVNRFRSAMKYVNTVSGLILVVAGVYIVWFGAQLWCPEPARWITVLSVSSRTCRNRLCTS